MAPAVNPGALRILEDLEAALALIVEGADYHHTVTVARSGRSFDEIHQWPAVQIGIGDLGDFADRQPGLVHAENTHWLLSIVGGVRNPSDSVASAIKMAADIYKAVMTDPQRSNLAIDTIWRGWTPGTLLDDNDTIAIVECRIDIHFRTKHGDLAEVV